MGGRFLLSKIKTTSSYSCTVPKKGFLTLEILQDTNEINTWQCKVQKDCKWGSIKCQSPRLPVNLPFVITSGKYKLHNTGGKENIFLSAFNT